MALEPITITVDGKPIRLFRGAEVRHALNWVGRLNQVQSGRSIVWDETAGAPTDPGGALYDGQRLSIRPTA
jgi:hypothetical protein